MLLTESVALIISPQANGRLIMIKNSKQAWEPGQTVKVGFLSLQVVAKIATPGDYRPDAYALKSATGIFYRFVPHFGIERCDNLEQAMAA